MWFHISLSDELVYERDGQITKYIVKDDNNIKTTRLTGLLDLAVYFNSSDVLTDIWC